MSRRKGTIGPAIALCAILGAPTAADAHDWEVAAGYVRLRDARTDISFPRGWLLSAARLLGPVTAVIEASRSATELPLVVGDASLSMQSVMGGARVSTSVGPFREFAQLLVGGVRAQGVLFGVESAETRLGWQPGVGLDYPWGRRYAARLAFDGRFISSQDGPWRAELRLSAAFVCSFR